MTNRLKMRLLRPINRQVSKMNLWQKLNFVRDRLVDPSGAESFVTYQEAAKRASSVPRLILVGDFIKPGPSTRGTVPSKLEPAALYAGAWWFKSEDAADQVMSLTW